jgi:hypothetical protein
VCSYAPYPLWCRLLWRMPRNSHYVPVPIMALSQSRALRAGRCGAVAEATLAT